METVTLRLPPAPGAGEEPGPAAAPPRTGRRSRLRRWPVLATVAGVLAVAVTGYFLFDPFRRGDASAASDGTGQRTSRWDPLPMRLEAVADLGLRVRALRRDPADER